MHVLCICTPRACWLQGGAALEMFQPAFARLVSLVQGRVRYPDAWRELDREERSDFKAAWQAIGDTLVDAAGMGALCVRPHARALVMQCRALPPCCMACYPVEHWQPAQCHPHCMWQASSASCLICLLPSSVSVRPPGKVVRAAEHA